MWASVIVTIMAVWIYVYWGLGLIIIFLTSILLSPSIYKSGIPDAFTGKSCALEREREVLVLIAVIRLLVVARGWSVFSEMTAVNEVYCTSCALRWLLSSFDLESAKLDDFLNTGYFFTHTTCSCVVSYWLLFVNWEILYHVGGLKTGAATYHDTDEASVCGGFVGVL